MRWSSVITTVLWMNAIVLIVFPPDGIALLIIISKQR